MKSITYTAARENLAATINRVCEDHAPVIITRNRDQSVVMLSLAEYESLEETAHLLRSPENAKRLLRSIDQLIKEIMRDPYRGIGKPEPLKHALQGYWSRRITGEHRIVYRVSGDDVRIARLRHHYRR